MWSNLFKSITFYAFFIGGLSAWEAYNIFVLEVFDRKFGGSPWAAFEVYVLGDIWLWCYLLVTFFILSFASQKIKKYVVSYPIAILIAIGTCLISVGYLWLSNSSWENGLRPDHVAIITLVIIFLILNISKKKS